MAQISSISNGEAMSTVRTKLNNVITEINLLDPTDWVDYSATSTIVGWSSFTPGYKTIRYRVIGKQVFVYFDFSGTSNSTTTTFTLPFQMKNTTQNLIGCYVVNNGAQGIGMCFMSANSNVFQGLLSNGSATWASGGGKGFTGQFNYEIA